MNLRYVQLQSRLANPRGRPFGPFAGRRRRVRSGAAAFVALGGVLLALLPSCAAGQGWRAVDVARTVTDSQPVAVQVRYGAGQLTVRGADAPYLYRMQLRYDETRSKAVNTFDPARHLLTLGISGDHLRWSPGKRSEAGEMTLALTRAVPMDLSLELGATESTLDLTGMRLRTLSVKSGASATSVRFDAASATLMDRIDVDAGAAAFKATGLANAGAAKIEVTGGLGLVELDFSGVWRRDAELSLTLAIGGGEITVPGDVGVRILSEQTLGSRDFAGMTQVADGAWETPRFADAKHKLVMRAKTTMGTLKLVRR